MAALRVLWVDDEVQVLSPRMAELGLRAEVIRLTNADAAVERWDEEATQGRAFVVAVLDVIMVPGDSGRLVDPNGVSRWAWSLPDGCMSVTRGFP